jgi:ribosomal protein S7
MRVKKVEKKYRKKLKKKFTIQPIYVKPKKRSSFVLRSIVNYTNLFSSYSFSERLFLAVFKSFTEQKNSFLYKRKLFMYSKLFKNNQKKVF